MMRAKVLLVRVLLGSAGHHQEGCTPATSLHPPYSLRSPTSPAIPQILCYPLHPLLSPTVHRSTDNSSVTNIREFNIIKLFNVFQITSILRAISFQKDPAYLSTFLKKTIIPRYSSNLSSLLRQIYDGLMQRPPKEILSPSQVTSEEETPLKSRKPLSSSKKVKSIEEAQ